MNWITLEELILIHERVIEETGGIHGMINPGGLESALARPFTTFGGQEMSRDDALVEEIKKLSVNLKEHIFPGWFNQTELEVKLNRIYFRKMQSKWASCSPRRNLTVNMLMRHLPEHLVEYIVFHETAHIIEKRHNEKFWGIVSKVFNNYQELEKDLFAYWFRVVNIR